MGNRFHKALVTGGAGFLGSFLSAELLGRGYEVIAVDNLFRGKEENIEHLKVNKNLQFYKLDLMLDADLQRLEELLVPSGIDIVFHYAAINGTKYFYDQPWQVLTSNTEITMNLLRVLDRVAGVGKIVYASSSEVYGSPSQIPTGEEYLVSLRSYSDRDSYAAAKAIGEFYVRLFCRNKGIPYLILRIFNTYGERMDTSEYGQVIPEFTRKILTEKEFTIIGDGSQSRTFCYIEDNVRLSLAASEMVDNEILNIGSQEEVTISELARLLHMIAGRLFTPIFLPGREHDHPRRCPSISKLTQLTGESPGVGLRKGLERVLEYYKSKMLAAG